MSCKSRVSAALPAEIILQIVSIVAQDAPSFRQPELYNCCLISRQWYSIAVPFLYEEPCFVAGNFMKFTATVCPPISARRLRTNLGDLVRHLDMSLLVHHSTNSLTARLLRRVKEELEVFIAPMASFSINCLIPLSKCDNLRSLDLSLVKEKLPFVLLKKAVCRLEKLVSFHFPRSTSLTVSDTTDLLLPWPSSLQHIRLSGSLPRDMGRFAWPENLSSLTLAHCNTLSARDMGSLLCNPHLRRSLKRLRVLPYNVNLDSRSLLGIPRYLPALEFLSAPGDCIADAFFDDLCMPEVPVQLAVLELRSCQSHLELGFSEYSVIKALENGHCNLRILRVGTELLYPGWEYGAGALIGQALLDHAKERLSESEMKNIEVGIRYIKGSENFDCYYSRTS